MYSELYRAMLCHSAPKFSSGTLNHTQTHIKNVTYGQIMQMSRNADRTMFSLQRRGKTEQKKTNCMKYIYYWESEMTKKPTENC